MTTQLDMTQPLAQAGNAIEQASVTLTDNTYLGRLSANLVPLSIGGAIGALIMVLLLVILKHFLKIKLI